jgi:hypothetical protein
MGDARVKTSVLLLYLWDACRDGSPFACTNQFNSVEPIRFGSQRELYRAERSSIVAASPRPLAKNGLEVDQRESPAVGECSLGRPHVILAFSAHAAFDQPDH